MSFPAIIRTASIILLSAWLAACGSSGGGSSSDGTLELKDLDGTWTTACLVDAPNSLMVELLINNGTLNSTTTTYAGNTCSGGVMMIELTNLSLKLGDAVTLDGSVAGITTATEVDATNTTPMSPDNGEVEYSIIAIKGDSLYYGDFDGVNDGTTPARRSIQLDDSVVFTRI